MSYFCTAGRGTESFLADELKQKASVLQISTVDGKVFFESDVSIEQFLTLRCAERLFIKVFHDEKFRMTKLSDIFGIKDKIPNLEEWVAAIDRWNEFLARTRETYKIHTDGTGNQEFGDNSPPKKRRRSDKMSKGDNIRFRVSCKCTGKPGKMIDSQRLGRQIGIGLSRKFGWHSNLRDPNTEILIQINNGGITVGIAVTRQPLSQRSYLHTAGLRSPVAYIMSQVAEIQDGEVILDPMCGTASILVEACNTWKSAMFIGCDNCSSQIQRAAENIAHAKMTRNIALIKADVKNLPIASQSIDAIICDAPFGINHSHQEAVRLLFPEMIKEMNRVLKPGGRVAILTSQELKDSLLLEVKSQTVNVVDTPQPPPQDMNNTLLNVKSQTENRVIPPESQEMNNTLQHEIIKSQAENEQHSQDIEDSCLEIKNEKEKVSDPCAQYQTRHSAQKVSEENLEILTDEVDTNLWTLKMAHYLKLGETHSYLCLFHKSET